MFITWIWYYTFLYYILTIFEGVSLTRANTRFYLLIHSLTWASLLVLFSLSPSLSPLLLLSIFSIAVFWRSLKLISQLQTQRVHVYVYIYRRCCWMCACCTVIYTHAIIRLAYCMRFSIFIRVFLFAFIYIILLICVCMFMYLWRSAQIAAC